MTGLRGRGAGAGSVRLQATPKPAVRGILAYRLRAGPGPAARALLGCGVGPNCTGAANSTRHEANPNAYILRVTHVS